MGLPADVARRRWRVLVAVCAVVGALASVALSAASYTDATGTAASLGTAACYYRASVQTGTAVSTTDGVTTATIAAVDPTRAFLMFSTRHNSNRPVASEIGGRIASTTTLEFYRDTNEVTPVAMTIEWSVVEYACGVSVQRGSVLQTTATMDIALTPLAATAQAFVLWSKNVHELDQTWDQNDPVIGDLTTTSNLEFRANALNVNHTIWWQVVEFTDAAMIRVQRGSTSLTGGLLSVDASLASPADQGRSFVLVGTNQPGAADMASSMVRGWLSGSTTLSIDRLAGTVDLPEIGWQVAELLDGSTVANVFASLSGVATTSAGPLVDFGVTPGALDLARTNAFASTQTGGGQNGGRTTYVADDIVGVTSFAIRLTSTTDLEMRRDFASAGTTADVVVFIVSWGLP